MQRFAKIVLRTFCGLFFLQSAEAYSQLLFRLGTLPEPTNLTTSAIGNSDLTLNWISGGGPTVSFKIAYQTGATAPANCDSGTTTTSGASPKVVTGLSSSTQYSFRVCSVATAGNKSSGVVTTATTTGAPPPDPTGLTLTLANSTYVYLTWTSGGGSTASFMVATQAGATAPADCTSGVSTGAVTNRSLSGLTPSTTYSARVCALDGSSNHSPGITLTYSTLAPPPPPTSPGASAISSKSINVSWTAAGGSATQYYASWLVGTTPPTTCTNGTRYASSIGTSYAFDGLVPSTTYAFRICSVDGGGGYSATTVTTTGTTDAPPPNVTGVTVGTIWATKMDVSWTSGGGTTATYKIAWQAGGSAPGDCNTGSTLSTGGTAAATLNGLSASTQYSFRVCAIDAVGTVASGTTATGTTNTTYPSILVITSGTTFTVPAGATTAKVWAIGGGGGGGGSPSADTTSGGGGGAGGVAYQSFSVTPGDTITYSIGAAGTGGVSSSSGISGGTTSVTVGGTTVYAYGGTGGGYNDLLNASGGSYTAAAGANGGFGAGATGDKGGGSGGAIGGANGSFSNGPGGSAGASSVDVSSIAAALAGAGGMPFSSGGPGSPTTGYYTNNENHGQAATGVGCGGGSAEYYGGNGGAGKFGGGGGGAAGYTAARTGGVGGDGLVIIELL